MLCSLRSLRATTGLVRLPAVDHNFTGPAYTIGIEEELMILDAASFELVNAIESCSSRRRPARSSPS